MSLAGFDWLRESKFGFARERGREGNQIRRLNRRRQQQKQRRQKQGGSSSRNSGDESSRSSSGGNSESIGDGSSSRSSSGGNSGSIGDSGSSRTHGNERLRDLAKMGERIAIREGRNVVTGESWEVGTR